MYRGIHVHMGVPPEGKILAPLSMKFGRPLLIQKNDPTDDLPHSHVCTGWFIIFLIKIT